MMTWQQDHPRRRRSYSFEYKVEAARLVIESGRPVLQVARELGIGQQMLGRWVNEEKARQSGEPTNPLKEDEWEELKRLRRENEELRKDNEFLKKAAAFFASQPKVSASQ